MSQRSPETQRVMELREKLGMGINEARRIVRKEETLAAIDRAENLDDIKGILRTIVEHWSMKP